MTSSTYIVHPLSVDDAARLRATGGRRYVADEKPGFPCRACLRDAEIGEELILVSHDPFDTDSPYRSASPVFLHADPCSAYDRPELPDQMTVRQLSVRAFDDDAMMLDAAVIDGRELDKIIDTMLDDPGIDHLHVHFAQRGCFAARVTRR